VKTSRRAFPVNRAIPSDPEIVFVELDRSLALLEAVEENVPRLSAGDLARIEALAHNLDQQRRWRASRIATRIVLERAGGLDCRKADFAIEANGRPSLARGRPHFNISHSAGAVLIATSNRAPVGVDLERLRSLAMTDDRRRRLVEAAARRTCGPELAPDRDADVVRAWVRLEAAAKALGTGIGRLLTEEGVMGGETQAAETGASARLDIRDLEVPQDYVATIAASNLPAQIDVAIFPDQADALGRFLTRSGG
jgi:4'-phosphopantetheinyl transferase